MTHLNIENSIAAILNNSDYIREQKSKGDIGLVSAYYDTASGEVFFTEMTISKHFTDTDKSNV